jgi:hypothetical protein
LCSDGRHQRPISTGADHAGLDLAIAQGGEHGNSLGQLPDSEPRMRKLSRNYRRPSQRSQADEAGPASAADLCRADHAGLDSPQGKAARKKQGSRTLTYGDDASDEANAAKRMKPARHQRQKRV